MANPLYSLPGLGAFYAAQDRNAAASGQELQQGMQMLQAGAFMQKQARQRRLEEMAALAGGDADKLIQGYMQMGDPEGAARVAQAVEVQRKVKESNDARDVLTSFYQNRQTAPQTQYTADRVAQGRASAIQARIEELNGLADAFAARGLAAQGMEYRKQAAEYAKLLPKFAATTKEVMGPDGRPRIVQFNDAGEPMDTGMSPATKLQFTSNGQRAGIGIDPYTGQVVSQGTQVFQSPDSVASTGLGYSRLAFDREQAKRPQLMNVEGVGVVSVPRDGGGASPVLMNGKPILSEKPLTEGQANATLFANRAAEAHKLMLVNEDKANTLALAAKRAAENLPFGGGAMTAGINASLSEASQLVDQARRDFVNAVLRKESGAVINPDEFANAEKQYFPQPGDSKAVIKQKREARARAIQGLTVAAGPGMGRLPPMPPTDVPTASTGKNIRVDY